MFSKRSGVNSWTLKFTFFPCDFLDVRISIVALVNYLPHYNVLIQEAIKFFTEDDDKAQIEVITIIEFQESRINTTCSSSSGQVPGLKFSDSNHRRPQTSINFYMDKEKVMSYRGGQNEPQFHNIDIDSSSIPHNDLDITVECNGKEFKIKKSRKRCICQMFYDYKIDHENGDIHLTTASAFVPVGHKIVSYNKSIAMTINTPFNLLLTSPILKR